MNNWIWFNKRETAHLSEDIRVVNVKVIIFWDVMLCSLLSRSGGSQIPSASL
jgi:hypothetical protein